MLKSVCLVGAVLLFAGPALAETACGTAPIAPAVATADSVAGKSADDAAKIKHEAFVQVKAYQATLKPFRDCLVTQTTAQKAAADAAKDDAGKKAAMEKMSDMQKVYDKTIDDETQVVNDYGALQAAVCKITDCTAPKK